jgi:hydroxypyruvate reductase
MIDVAVLEPSVATLVPGLATSYRLHPVGDDPADWPLAARSARALVTSGGRGATAAQIDALPALEIIAINGVGYDAVDFGAARRRGIRVTNTPGVLTADVADLAISLITAVFRRTYAAERHVRDGSWAAGVPLPLGRSASGHHLGILGLGRIGKAIAARAAPMMASIAYTGRHPQPEVQYDFVPSLRELAEKVTIFVIAVPGSPDTAGLVDAAVLEALGPDGVLINIARGNVVDEAALVAALTSGRLGGAGLDVFAHEPNVPNALLGLENVVLQPHRGSATSETRTAMAQLVATNLAAHFSGQPLQTEVL